MSVAIRNTKVELADLLHLDCAELKSEIRGEGVHVVSVVLDYPGVSVVNVFAPKRKAFWSFSLFSNQERSSLEYAESTMAEGVSEIERAMRSAAFRRPSIQQ